MTITVNGREYEINDKYDLQSMRTEHYEDWYAIRTANEDLIMMALDLYEDELDQQDEKASTGTYGKRKEVTARVQHAIDNGSKIWLHDIRCRKIGADDQRIAGTRIEHKTGFAQWAYGYSANECWNKLNRQVEKGIEYHWDPFKDECEIILPIGELLEYLAQYNESKGLQCWFTYNVKMHQLQLQPVKNSYKRYRWIAELVQRQNPNYKIIEKDKYRG